MRFEIVESGSGKAIFDRNWDQLISDEDTCSILNKAEEAIAQLKKALLEQPDLAVTGVKLTSLGVAYCELYTALQAPHTDRAFFLETQINTLLTMGLSRKKPTEIELEEWRNLPSPKPSVNLPTKELILLFGLPDIAEGLNPLTYWIEADFHCFYPYYGWKMAGLLHKAKKRYDFSVGVKHG